MEPAYQLLDEDLFSDLTQRLVDPDTEISMRVHRTILFLSGGDYFKNLLSKFMERQMDTITINVPNAHAAHNIIMQFCGKHPDLEWWDVLASIKCRDYCGLNYDTECELLKK